MSLHRHEFSAPLSRLATGFDETWEFQRVVGLLPSLLFLPYFLGYVPFTFTSAFPAGGVFYPYILVWFRGLPWTSLDAWLLRSAPQLFEPLTQHPGPMLAVTGMGGVGPVATCGLGVVIGITIFGSGSAWRSVRSRLDRM